MACAAAVIRKIIIFALDIFIKISRSTPGFDGVCIWRLGLKLFRSEVQRLKKMDSQKPGLFQQRFKWKALEHEDGRQVCEASLTGDWLDRVSSWLRCPTKSPSAGPPQLQSARASGPLSTCQYQLSTAVSLPGPRLSSSSQFPQELWKVNERTSDCEMAANIQRAGQEDQVRLERLWRGQSRWHTGSARPFTCSRHSRATWQRWNYHNIHNQPAVDLL
ncbi:hypothetical protein ROHU_008586 [Labeo rohita]|uniref:Uncharacterized protein n=1 Tax=Labeo rohita TaxID=84645 RepID=A0A498MEH1_LABRO|nr:hypothetical protein ROHU_008586 [Labeo rohita]